MSNDKKLRPEELLADILVSAAKQRRWQIPRREDRHIVDHGGIVLHAVDTDVIKLFTSPWSMSPNSKMLSEGYAHIFPHVDGDGDDLDIALGKALAEYIFETLCVNVPAITLPPLGEEIQTVFTGVAKAAETEHAKKLTELTEIKALFRDAKSMDEPEKILDILTPKIKQIVRFLNGDTSKLEELRRFSLLFKHTLIAPPEYIIQKGLLVSPVMIEAFAPPSGLGDRIHFRDKVNVWFELLKKEKGDRAKTTKIFTDAQMLARLGWVNGVLSRLVPAGQPICKLVLITGSIAIHHAAEHHPNKGFAERYLRHPRAYLGEKGVLEPPQEGMSLPVLSPSDTQVDQWLDTFLSQFHPGSDKFEHKLDWFIGLTNEQLIEHVKPMLERPEIVVEFNRNWNIYTQNLVLDRKVSKFELQLKDDSQVALIDQYELLLDEVESDLHEKIHEVWDECFSTIADGMGYSLLNVNTDKPFGLTPRNAPLLTFDSFSATKEFVHDVITSFSGSKLDVDLWKDGLMKIRKEDDKSGYAVYVALGVLFAAAGIWRVSAILANRALYVLERCPVENISGREAFYLRAVALRHVSRKIKDLRVVFELLDRAESAYDLDLKRKVKAAPCRFMVERQAAYLSCHLYRVLIEKAKIPDNFPSKDRKVPALPDLLFDIDVTLLQVETSTEDKQVVRFTERSLLVNWIMASLLRLKDSNVKPDVARFEEIYLKLQHNIDSRDDDFPVSFYVETIRLLGRWYIEPDKKRKKLNMKELDRWINDETLKTASVMTYDKQRYTFFKDLINNNI